MFRRAIATCVVLAVAAGVATLPAPAGATPPCPVEYCTDSSGTYTLTVPPLSTIPVLEQYADCTWKVHVDFGDGTSEDLIFEASAGITRSHTFPPSRGVTYTVEIQLREGHHGTGTEPCFDYTRKAEVRYRTAAEEEDKPPPWEVIEQREIVPEPIPLQPTGYVPNPYVGGPPGFQSMPAVRFWKNCHAGIRAHGVSCKKGRLVIGRAREKLAPRGSGRVAGFDCGLNSVSVVCRRGDDRVLGPVG